MDDRKQLCVVQMHWEISDYRDAASFEAKIRSVMEAFRAEADPKAISLIAFPEDIGAPLVFLNAFGQVKNSATLGQAVQRLIRINLPSILKQRIKYRVGWFRGLALAKSAAMARVYLDVFSRMAREYGVYLASGTALLPDFSWQGDIRQIEYRIPDGCVYNIAFLFDPRGRLIGTQKKTHLVPGLEDSSGFDLCAGKLDDLEVFDTPLGRIGLAICLDCFKSPVTEALVQKGAQILIQPSANSKPWSRQEQQDWMEGSWKAMARENTFQYALNPMMTGHLFDLGFEGQSSIISGPKEGPAQLGYKDLPMSPGFVKMADSPLGEEIILMTIEP